MREARRITQSLRAILTTRHGTKSSGPGMPTTEMIAVTVPRKSVYVEPQVWSRVHDPKQPGREIQIPFDSGEVVALLNAEIANSRLLNIPQDHIDRKRKFIEEGWFPGIEEWQNRESTVRKLEKMAELAAKGYDYYTIQMETPSSRTDDESEVLTQRWKDYFTIVHLPSNLHEHEAS